jgi:transcriptional regulator with XRE-family HTH domain
MLVSSMTGENLKRRREELGLSQALLARRFGVDVMTVSRWERGDRKITAPGAIRLALDYLRLHVKHGPCGNCGRDASAVHPERCLCGAMLCGECWERDGRCREHVGT